MDGLFADDDLVKYEIEALVKGTHAVDTLWELEQEYTPPELAYELTTGREFKEGSEVSSRQLAVYTRLVLVFEVLLTDYYDNKILLASLIEEIDNFQHGVGCRTAEELLDYIRSKLEGVCPDTPWRS